MNTHAASGWRAAAASSRGPSAEQYGQVNEPNSITSGLDRHRQPDTRAVAQPRQGEVRCALADPGRGPERVLIRQVTPSGDVLVETGIVVRGRAAAICLTHRAPPLSARPGAGPASIVSPPACSLPVTGQPVPAVYAPCLAACPWRHRLAGQGRPGVRHALTEREDDQPLPKAWPQPVSRVPAQGPGQPGAGLSAGRQDHLVVMVDAGLGEI